MNIKFKQYYNDSYDALLKIFENNYCSIETFKRHISNIFNNAFDLNIIIDLFNYGEYFYVQIKNINNDTLFSVKAKYDKKLDYLKLKDIKSNYLMSLYKIYIHKMQLKNRIII